MRIRPTQVTNTTSKRANLATATQPLHHATAQNLINLTHVLIHHAASTHTLHTPTSAIISQHRTTITVSGSSRRPNKPHHTLITLQKRGAKQAVHAPATSYTANNPNVVNIGNGATSAHNRNNATSLNEIHDTAPLNRTHTATRQHVIHTAAMRHERHEATIRNNPHFATSHATNRTVSVHTRNRRIPRHQSDTRLPHSAISLDQPIQATNLRASRHLIKAHTKHALGTKIAINDATIHARHRERTTSIRVQRILATTVNNVNKIIPAGTPLSNVNATHARHILTVIAIKPARSIHHKPTIRSKRITHTIVSVARTASEPRHLALNQRLSSRLSLTLRPVMRRIRTKRTPTRRGNTLPRLLLTIHMPPSSHNKPHPSHKRRN